MALAWLLAQGEDIIPIPGTTKLAVRSCIHLFGFGTLSGVDPQNIQENLAAMNIKLSPEDVQEVRRIAQAADAGKADRYPPVWMHLLFADTPAL